MITIGVPVLRRYDLLRRLLLSLRPSVKLVQEVVIVDNGQCWSKIAGAIGGTLPADRFDVWTPAVPMGVAESWNYLTRRTTGARIITNDDIIFGEGSIAQMLATEGDIVLGYGFSCFLLRDSCVDAVGEFDENISPGYAYFEDCDYAERIRRANADGKSVRMVNAFKPEIIHGDGKDGSWTYRAGSEEEQREHWRKFDLAKANFVKKWGAEPQVLEARWSEAVLQ